MKSGFLVIDKPAGFTSHDIVAIARKSLAERRVGHAGTLDPFATGVLVLGVGNGTRLLQYITDGKKSYQATIRLGSATTTDDLTGECISENYGALASLTDLEIRAKLSLQIGEIYQRPSSFSAIKVDGKRAYELARAGEAVTLKERKVTIHSLIVEEITRTSNSIDIGITVECSAGTYIRSIARDLGEVLEVGGHLTELRRLRVHPYSLIDAISLEQLREKPDLLSIDSAIVTLFPRRDLTREEVASVGHGRSIELSEVPGSQPISAAFAPSGGFIALLSEKNGRAHPILVMNRES